MSDQLHLTDALAQELLRNLREHDAKCGDDLIACQYLAAVIGYLIGNQQFDPRRKQEFAEELSQFIQHVIRDLAQQPPPPDPDKAFGIWKPEKT